MLGFVRRNSSGCNAKGLLEGCLWNEISEKGSPKAWPEINHCPIDSSAALARGCSTNMTVHYFTDLITKEKH